MIFKNLDFNILEYRNDLKHQQIYCVIASMIKLNPIII